MNLLQSINLSASHHAAPLRGLLRSIGYCGPWSETGDGQLRVIETDGCTLVTFGVESSEINDLVRSAPINARTSTVTLSGMGEDLPMLLFPIRGLPHRHLLLTDLQEKALVLRARFSKQHLAFAGRRSGAPVLVIGFVLSDFLQRVSENLQFHGYSHLRLLLKWFIEEFARVSAVKISPWPDGRPPLVLTFDVEKNVGQRSLGRRVLRIGFGSRSLVQVHRLRLIRPLITKRLVLSSNHLQDGDESVRSLRAMVDLRRGRIGTFADHPTVSQWQVQFGMQRDPHHGDANHRTFAGWVREHAHKSTAFCCGASNSRTTACANVGFHSFEHRHYNQRRPADIRAELNLAADTFFEPDELRAVRAPGLLWNDAYFRALGEAGFACDSSFREVNHRQPVAPIRTAHGWWEIPVNGNLMRVGADDAMLRVADLSDGMLSLYAHDHDVDSQETSADFDNKLADLCAAGFSPISVQQLFTHLDAACNDEVSNVQPRDDGTIDVAGCVSARSRIQLANMGGYEMKTEAVDTGDVSAAGAVNVRLVRSGHASSSPPSRRATG